MPAPKRRTPSVSGSETRPPEISVRMRARPEWVAAVDTWRKPTGQSRASYIYEAAHGWHMVRERNIRSGLTHCDWCGLGYVGDEGCPECGTV